MQRPRIRRAPKSLSSSQIAVRVVIAGVVMFLLVFIGILVNHWYLYTHSEAPKEVVSSSHPPPETESKGELFPAASDAHSEPEKESPLTFYDRLTKDKPLDSENIAASPTNGAEQSSQSPAAPQTPVTLLPPPGEEGKARFGYTVQVGAFQTLQYADEILASLKKQGFSPELSTVYLSNGKTWNRVRVGNFASREEAEAMVQKLKESGKFEPMIISPEKAKEEAHNVLNNSRDSAAAQSPSLSPQGTPVGEAPTP